MRRREFIALIGGAVESENVAIVYRLAENQDFLP